MKNKETHRDYLKKLLLENYPAAKNRFQKNDYRLKDFLNYSNDDLKIIEEELWHTTLEKVKDEKVVKNYKNLEYLGNGWEFSVFRLNKEKVIKIPCGYFDDVDTDDYFYNMIKIHNLLHKEMDNKFFPKTEIKPKQHIIIQDYIDGKEIEKLGYNTHNKKRLAQLLKFTESVILILKKYDWIPDVNIKRMKGGIRIDNIFFDSNDNLFFGDFSVPYNIFRMYPKRMEEEVKNKGKILQDFKLWIESRINSI